MQIEGKVLLARVEGGGLCTGLDGLTVSVGAGKVCCDWWEARSGIDVAGVVGVFSDGGPGEDHVVGDGDGRRTLVNGCRG
jgi:hypothetical protein